MNFADYFYSNSSEKTTTPICKTTCTPQFKIKIVQYFTGCLEKWKMKSRLQNFYYCFFLCQTLLCIEQAHKICVLHILCHLEKKKKTEKYINLQPFIS